MLKIMSVVSLMMLTLTSAQAAGDGERLQMTFPDGYAQGFSDANAKIQIVEFVPIGQTVEDWQELLSVQVFYGMTKVTARGFADSVIRSAVDHCPQSSGVVIRNEFERGYDTALFMVSCPGSDSGQRTEWTLFKGILGRDSFYLVHKAWAYRPDREAVVEWSQFLYGVGLCDTRRADAPCKAEN